MYECDINRKQKNITNLRFNYRNIFRINNHMFVAMNVNSILDDLKSNFEKLGFSGNVDTINEVVESTIVVDDIGVIMDEKYNSILGKLTFEVWL